MKITIRNIILDLLILMVLVTGFNLYNKDLFAEEKATCKLEVEEKKENVTEEHISGTILYPLLKPSIGCKWEDFNNKIESDIKSWKEDVLTIRDEYFNDYVSNFKPTFEMDSRYEIGINRDGLFSGYIDYYQYTGGAHGITVRRSYNYDGQLGKFFTIDKLFKNGYDYETPINKKIKEEISKNKDMYFNEGEYFKGIDKTPNFYLTEEGIVVYFQLYEIAPYASGIPEFKIPYELIKDGLL